MGPLFPKEKVGLSTRSPIKTLITLLDDKDEISSFQDFSYRNARSAYTILAWRVQSLGSRNRRLTGGREKAGLPFSFKLDLHSASAFLKPLILKSLPDQPL